MERVQEALTLGAERAAHQETSTSAEKPEEAMEQGGHRRRREAAPKTWLIGLKQQEAQEGRTLNQPRPDRKGRRE